MTTNAKIDDADLQIIKILQTNGRMSATTIAKKMGISRDKVIYRIRRLEHKGIIIGYNCFVNYEAVTSGFYAIMSLKVQPHQIDKIIQQILSLEETFMINDITGDYDLEIIGLFETRDTFEAYLKTKLASIDGIERINSRIFLSIHHHGVKIIPDPPTLNTAQHSTTLDNIDLGICRTLLIDGRAPANRMAKALGVSAQTISNRMKKLEKLHIIRHYHARIDYSYLGRPLFASIGLRITPNKFKIALTAILKLKPLFVDEITGNQDLHLQIAIKDTSELREFIRDKLEKIDGIQEIESHFVIHQYLKLPDYSK